jgi:hypothetical protein
VLKVCWYGATVSEKRSYKPNDTGLMAPERATSQKDDDLYPTFRETRAENLWILTFENPRGFLARLAAIAPHRAVFLQSGGMNVAISSGQLVYGMRRSSAVYSLNGQFPVGVRSPPRAPADVVPGLSGDPTAAS